MSWFYLVGPEVKILTKNYFWPEYWPIKNNLEIFPKMRMSEKCCHKNKSDNSLTPRRTNGGEKSTHTHMHKSC